MATGGGGRDGEAGTGGSLSGYLRRLEAVNLSRPPSPDRPRQEPPGQDSFSEVRARIEAEMGLPAPAIKIPDAPKFRARPVPAVPPGGRAAWFRPAIFLPLLALALAGGLSYSRRPALAKDHLHQMASSNISGISWKAGDLWAGDWVTGTVYRYACPSEDPVLMDSYPLASTHITSMSVAGDRVYVWDSWTGQLHIRRLKPGLPLLHSVRPGKKPSAIYDGRNLWTCGEDGVLSRRAPDPPLTELDAYQLEERPQLFFLDGKELWTSDADGFLYRRTLDGALSRPTRHVIPDLNRKYPVSAFAWRDGRLWLAQDGKPEVAEIGRDSLIPSE